MSIRVLGALVAALLLVLGLGTTSCNAETTLRVWLFPYLPDPGGDGDDFTELKKRVKTEFEQRNPGIRLEIRMDHEGWKFNHYDVADLERGLEEVDLIEIDTVMLGALRDTGKIAPWSEKPREDEWHDAARSGVTVDDEVWAIPHLLCGFFLFSRDEDVVAASNFTAMIEALDQTGPNPNLAGNFISSWDAPMLYLDGWVDAPSPAPLAEALKGKAPKPEIVERLKTLAQECRVDDKNPCTDCSYKDNTKAAEAFGRDKVDAAFGYSERLYYIVGEAKEPAEINVTALPLGQRNQPLLFTDALVRRKGCTGACEDAANKFAEYMLDPETLGWILMSGDVEGATPRYLLPATMSAFDVPSVRSDRLYGQLRRATESGGAFPNSAALLAWREKVKDSIQEDIGRECPE